METPLFQGMTKATTAEGAGVRRSFNWVVARRGRLKVFRDRLECGDWKIPFGDVSNALLISTSQMFIPGFVLCVAAHGRVYQFGLNYNRFWKGDLPFAVKREKRRLGYSLYSIVIRIIVAGVLLSWLWRWFAGGK